MRGWLAIAIFAMIVLECATTKLKVNVRNQEMGMDESIIINVDRRGSLAATVFRVCATYEFTNDQCNDLYEGMEKLYDAEHEHEDYEHQEQEVGNTTLLSYSNRMLPRYFVSANPIYRGDFKDTTDEAPAPPNVQEMAKKAARMMLRGRRGEREKFARAFERSSTYQDCIKVTIRSGEVGVNEREKGDGEEDFWWRERRKAALVKMLLRLGGEGRLKDTELIFCPKDCLSKSVKNDDAGFGYPANYGGGEMEGGGSGGDDNGIQPYFSLVACDGAPVASMPVFASRGKTDPDFEQWDNFTARELFENVHYRGKGAVTKKAIFRGNFHGKSCWDGDVRAGRGVSKKNGDSCGRRRLLQIGALNQDVFDVGFDYIPLQAQEGFMLSISLEGHCGWSDRGKYLIFMGSVLVRQER